MPHALDLMTSTELTRLPVDADACFGCLATARGHLPLEAMDVQARLRGLASHLELRQTFVNTLDLPVEATYVFPLPDRAAVTRFRLVVGDRVVEGVIKERGQARADYDQALADGHRAAIAEEERPDVFTVRVGNLLAGERARIELELVGPLSVDDGEVTFRFPLVVAPRYIPGRPIAGPDVGDGTAGDTDAVPDASRITPPVLLPGYPNPVRLSFAVEIDPLGLPIGQLRSSLHAVDEQRQDGRHRIALRGGERLDRDFVLRYQVGDGQVRTGLSLTPDGDGVEGTFTLTVVPPLARGEGRPRDVVVVLDRSGSMEGWKMVAARRAAARMIDSLCERDRFAVLAFDDRIDAPPTLGASLAAASDRHRYRAVEFLSRLDSRGGTEMAAPLAQAAKLLAGGTLDRDRVMVLVTDGQVGNEDQILRRLGPSLRGLRVFTLGIDQAVNAGFLRRLAAAGGGSCELIESEDRLDDAMARIHRRIAAPVVTELALAAEGIEVVADSIRPRRLPDLLTGAPLVVRGRFRGRAAGRVVVTGRDREGGSFRAEVEGEALSADRSDAAMWARASIRELEDRYAIDGRPELADLVIATSLRFQVLSRFTAFLAVDRSERVNPGGPGHRVIQAVESPAGWAEEDLDEAPRGGFGGAPSGAVMPQAQAAPAPSLARARMSAPAGARSMAAPPRQAPPAPSAPMKKRAAEEAKEMLAMHSRREVDELADVDDMDHESVMAGSLQMAEMPCEEPMPEPEAERELDTDLMAYRERLARAITLAAAGGDPPRAIAGLALALEELLADLVSIDAPRALEELLADLVSIDAPRALREQLDEVLQLLRHDSRSAAVSLAEAVDRLRRIEAAMARPTPPPSRSRWAFWR